jgi:outer membrane protein OmpA-like peptidoglycan-associated protein
VERGPLLLAQQQPTGQEKQHEQKKAAPPQKAAPPASHPEPKAEPKGGQHVGFPPQKGGQPEEHKALTPPTQRIAPLTPPPAPSPKKDGSLPEHKALSPSQPPPQRVAPASPPPAPSKDGSLPALSKEPKHASPAQPGPAIGHPPVGGQPGGTQASGARPPLPKFVVPQHAAGPAPHVDQLQKARHTRVEDGGKRTIIEEPGNRTIIKQDNRLVIRHDDGERFRALGGANVRTEKRPDGMVETFYVRPDGVRVVSVVDGSGRLVRRYRRGVDGREFNIIDNRRFWGGVAVVGVGALAIGVLLALPPPVITLPPERYIVAYDRASDDDLYEALSAGPIEPLERAYSLEEIRDNYALRQRLRKINLDTINFDFGSWLVAEVQYPKLEHIAHVMLRLLDRNPDEVFLVAAYTDAVGSDVDNLSLSDRRAEAVAEVLSATFGVPPENLVTQGYGAQFLLIDTPGPEVRNRRVEIQRITPLMAER